MGTQHPMTALYRQIGQAFLEEPEYNRTKLSTPMTRIASYALAQFLVRGNHRQKMSVVTILLTSLIDLGVPIVWPPEGTMHLIGAESHLTHAHCLFWFLTTVFSEIQILKNFSPSFVDVSTRRGLYSQQFVIIRARVTSTLLAVFANSYAHQAPLTLYTSQIRKRQQCPSSKRPSGSH